MVYVINLRFAKNILIFILSAAVFLGIGRYILIPVVYPMKYSNMVNKYSLQYNIKKELVFAMIRTESRFDKNALSHKGAKGLMQITNMTGQWAADEIGLQGYTSDSLFDPDINIQIGCWYISKLITQYNNLEVALAAYNGGSGNVSGWLEDKNYSLDNETLIRIPFEETRNFVKKIITDIKIYMWLLGERT